MDNTEQGEKLPKLKLSFQLSFNTRSLGHGMSDVELLSLALDHYKRHCLTWLVRYHAQTIEKDEDLDFSDSIAEWEHIKTIEEWQFAIVQALTTLAENNAIAADPSLPLGNDYSEEREADQANAYCKLFNPEKP